MALLCFLRKDNPGDSPGTYKAGDVICVLPDGQSPGRMAEKSDRIGFLKVPGEPGDYRHLVEEDAPLGNLRTRRKRRLDASQLQAKRNLKPGRARTLTEQQLEDLLNN